MDTFLTNLNFEVGTSNEGCRGLINPFTSTFFSMNINGFEAMLFIGINAAIRYVIFIH